MWVIIEDIYGSKEIRLMKTKNLILEVLGILLFIAALVGLSLRFGLLTAPLKASIQSELQKELHREVSIGIVEGGFIHPLVLRNFKISQGQKLSGGLWVSVDTVMLDFSWWDLLTGRVSLKKSLKQISLINPTLYLKSYDLQGVLSPGSSSPSSFFGLTTHWVVVGGKVFVQDKVKPYPYSLQAVNGTAQIRGQKVSVQLSSKVSGSNLQVLEGQLSYDLLTKQGEARVLGKRLDGRIFNSFMPFSSPFPVKATVTAGSVDLALYCPLEPDKALSPVVNFSLTKGEILIPSLPKPLSQVELQGVYRDRGVMVEQAKALFMDSTWSGAFRLTLTPKIYLQGEFTLEEGHVDQLAGLIPALRKFHPMGKVSGHLTASGFLPDFSISGKIIGQDVGLGLVASDQLDFLFKWDHSSKKDDLDLSNIQGKFWGGGLSGKARLKGGALEGELKALAFSLSKTAGLYGWDQIGGWGSAEATLGGSLNEPKCQVTLRGYNITYQERPIPDLFVQGSWSKEAVNLKIDSSNSMIQGRGKLRLSPKGQEIEGRISLKKADLATLGSLVPLPPSLSGEVWGSTEWSGTLASPRVEGSFTVKPFLWRGRPLQEVQAGFSYAEHQWSIRDGSVSGIGSGRIDYSGTIQTQGDHYAFKAVFKGSDWDAGYVPGLIDLYPHAQGKLALSGQVQGNWDDLTIAADIFSDSFVFDKGVESPLSTRLVWSKDRLKISSVSLGGKILGSGEVNWKKDLILDVKAESKAAPLPLWLALLRSSPAGSPATGTVDGEASLNGSLDKLQGKGRIRIKDGKWGGLAFQKVTLETSGEEGRFPFTGLVQQDQGLLKITGEGGVAAGEKEISLKKLNVLFGGDHFIYADNSWSGQLDLVSNGNWSLARGLEYSAEGKMKGWSLNTHKGPDLDFSFQLDRNEYVLNYLHYGNVLQAEGRWDAKENALTRLQLATDGLDLEKEWTLFMKDNPPCQGVLRCRISFEEGLWKGNGAIVSGQWGNIPFRVASVNFSGDTKVIHLDQVRVQQEEGTLLLQGTLRQQPEWLNSSLQLGGSVYSLPLKSLLEVWIKSPEKRPSLDGRLSGSVLVTGTLLEPQCKIFATLNNLSLGQELEGEASGSLYLEKNKIEITDFKWRKNEGVVLFGVEAQRGGEQAWAVTTTGQVQSWGVANGSLSGSWSYQGALCLSGDKENGCGDGLTAQGLLTLQNITYNDLVLLSSRVNLSLKDRELEFLPNPDEESKKADDFWKGKVSWDETGNVTFNKFVLPWGSGTLLMDGQIGGQSIRPLVVEGKDIGADKLLGLLLPKLSPHKGSSSFHLILRSSGENPGFQGSFKVVQGSFSSIPYDLLTGWVSWSKNALELKEFRVNQVKEYEIDMKGSIPLTLPYLFSHIQGNLEREYHLSASVKGKASYLSLILPVKAVQGEGNGDFRITGTSQYPVLNGSYVLDQGSFDTDWPFKHYSQVQASLLIHDNHVLISRAVGQVEGKEVTLSGEVLLKKLQVDGWNIKFASQPGTFITVDQWPEVFSRGAAAFTVSLTGPAYQPLVQGEVTLTQADVSYQAQSSQEVSPFKDFRWQVKVTAGRSVRYYRGNMVDIEIPENSSLVFEGPTEDLQINGAIDCNRGTFDYLNTTFDVREILLKFSRHKVLVDALGQATVIETDRQGQENQIQVRAKVEGELPNPVVTLSSVPERDQREIASLLMVGDDITQMSENDLQKRLVMEVLKYLGFNNLLPVLKEAKKKTGLDVLKIGSSRQATTNNNQGNNAHGVAQVDLGKYLYPNLYLDYRTTLGNRGDTSLGLGVAQELGLEYQLTESERLKLRYRGINGDFFGGIETQFPMNWGSPLSPTATPEPAE